LKKIRKKVLLTVKAYPLPSRSYGELVCTAGVDEDGNWVRIYPVPLAFLNSEEFKKYTWIEIDLIKREKGKDFRPESHSPANLDLSDIEVVGVLGTGHEWAERRKYCLREVYTSLRKLWEDAKPAVTSPLPCSNGPLHAANLLLNHRHAAAPIGDSSRIPLTSES